MLSTACRRVNGKLRQKPFGIEDMVIKTDRAPRSRFHKPRNLNLYNSQPVLYAPSYSSDKMKRKTSNTGIRKNQEMEQKLLLDGIQMDVNSISTLATKQDGAYGRPIRLSREMEKNGQKFMGGDFVAFLSEKNGVGVVLPHDDSKNTRKDSQSNFDGMVVVDSKGVLHNVKSSSVTLCFPAFIALTLARNAADPDYRIGQERMLDEHFNEDRFKSRAKICNRLNVLDRQTEAAIRTLTPAFEATMTSREALDSLHYSSKRYITTSDVAKKLVQYSLRAARKKQSEVDQEEEMDKKKDVRLYYAEATLYSRMEGTGWADYARASGKSLEDIIASSAPVLLATHTLLFRHSDYFSFDAVRHLDTQTFTVRSHEEIKALLQVRKWVHASIDHISGPNEKNHLDPIKMFAEKARQVIKVRKEESRAAFLENPGTPKVIESKALAKVRWSSDDVTIIRSLRVIAGKQARTGEKDALKALVMFITKECGVKHEMPATFQGQEENLANEHRSSLPQAAATELLQQLGLLTPWENLANVDLEFRHLIDNHVTAQESAMNLTSDPDADIRKDMDLPVYVIDDEGAHELDDGISIESTSQTNVYWIRVSIADPTTSIQPGDEIAKRAQRFHTSFYHPEGQWSMIPPSITEQYGLRVEEKEQSKYPNALEISARINIANGRVSQYDIRLTRLKNVKVMKYNQVSSILSNSNTDKVEESVKKDLQNLHQAAIWLEQRRRSIGGALIAEGNKTRVSLEPNSLAASPLWQILNRDDYSMPPLFSGFPHIHCHIINTAEEGIGPRKSLSRGLVSEMMILAGRVVGAWAKERDLPLLYRGQLSPPNKQDCQLLHELRDEDGLINYKQLLQSNIKLMRGTTSTQVEQHFSMGINTSLALNAISQDADMLTASGYARVTSPLRRYPDLMNHWQIKQSLRKGQDHKPFYSRNELLEVIPHQDRMATWVKQNERNSHQFFLSLKLLRGIQSRLGKVQLSQAEKEETYPILDGKHDALVTIEDLRLSRSLHGRVRVILSKFGLPAELKFDYKKRAPKIGTSFRVKITDVYITGQNSFILVESTS